MRKKRNYVSPLWLQGLNDGGDVEIITEGSVETGGTLGGECWSLNDMFDGKPAAKIEGCDGTLLGYYDMDSETLYDTDGTEVDFQDWMGDIDFWLEEVKGWYCYEKCPELAD
ncbi:MAG: hypothetical protein IJ212_05070 [Bacteroidaceae bacterium]|nr:hypothetical protein [Bacteroidaceae bacterium]